MSLRVVKAVYGPTWADCWPGALESAHYAVTCEQERRYGRENWWKYPPQAARQTPRRDVWEVRLYWRSASSRYIGPALAARDFKTEAEARKAARSLLTNMEAKHGKSKG